MFRKQVIIYVFLLTVGLAWITSRLVIVTSEDQEAYHKLISNSKASQMPMPAYKAKQFRQNVNKNFLFMKNQQRLQLKVSSISSELVLEHNQGKTELVEHFNDLNGFCKTNLITLRMNPVKLFAI